MMHGVFYMIDNLLGRTVPIKRLAEELRLKMEGQKARRKAEQELAALKKPEHKL